MDDDWGDYYFWDGDDDDYPDDSIVTLAPFEVTPGEDDSNVGPGGDSDEPDDWFFPTSSGLEDIDTDDWEWGLGSGNTDPTAGILQALNGYRPGWEKVNDTTYKNTNTGETYSTVTEKITSPKPSSTNAAGGTRTPGSSTNPGGTSGGSSSGGSQSSAQSTIDKALAALGALANAFTKVSGAVHGTTPTTTTAANAAATAQQQNAQTGKILLGVAAGVGVLLYLKTRKK